MKSLARELEFIVPRPEGDRGGFIGFLLIGMAQFGFSLFEIRNIVPSKVWDQTSMYDICLVGHELFDCMAVCIERGLK